MSNNQSEQKEKRGINLLYPLGKRLSKVLSITFIFGLGLCALNDYYLKKECEVGKQSTALSCFLSPIAWNLGSSLITSVFTIAVAEIALRDEILQQIQEIWNSRQATRYIKAFYPKQKLYKQLILDNINNAQPNQVIKLLGLSEELKFLGNSSDIKMLKDKIKSGCHFKILILHPDSSVFGSMETVGCNNFKESLRGDVLSILKKIADDLSKKETDIKGSIEVRLQKDLFSPICYYSSSGINIVWMYFSNSEGFEYPGFDILDEALIKEADLHFDNLWEKSVGEPNLLLKINKVTGSSINHIDTMFERTKK